MAEGVLARLAANSREAVAAGVYDGLPDLSGLRSGGGLAREAAAARRPVLICEVKFASPSLGGIRARSDPAALAREMVSGGASAVSVLTQPRLFGGSPADLAAVRRAVRAPLLMKDVIVDAAQVDAAARLGADYVLLVQALFDAGLAEDAPGLARRARRLGMGVIAEAHTEAELASAEALGADLVGVNNRDLDTLEVDLGVCERLLPLARGGAPLVAESGISTPADVRRMREAGAAAFLVGSSVMGGSDIRASVARLAGAY